MLTRSFRRFVGPSRRCFSTTKPVSSGLCFDISEEQKEMQNVTRKFVRDEVVPKAAEKDKEQEYPWDWVNKMHSLGLMNTCISPEHGGVGLSIVDEAIIDEELSYGCSALGAINVANNLAQTPVALFGSEHLKKKYLTRMTEEPMLASYCATEPGAGSDLAALRTRAVKKGDKWVINGQKMWITNAGVANWFTVFTRTDPDEKCPTRKAFTAFVVEADSPGVTMGRKEINMGQRCSDTRGILFEDVEVPEENVIGEVSKGFPVAMGTFDASRAPTAAVGVGIMQRCLEESTKYSMERKTFGVPIAQHQAVSMMIAEMAMHVELSRLMVYKAAYEHTQGRRNTYFSSIAKAFAGDMAMKSAIDCVQVFGGNGFNTEYPAEKLMRDAKILQIYEGTSQIQRLVIFREWAGIMAKMGL